MNLSDYKGVMVICEQRGGELQKVSLELIGKAADLAKKLNEPVIAALVGHNIKHLAKDLIAYGADKVVVAEDPMLDLYVTEPYVKAYTGIVKQENPSVALFGASTIGRDLAPRVSARIHTGLTADCTSLDIEEGSNLLLMTRPAFGGNIMATIKCPDYRPQMSTVRPGVMQRLDKDPSRAGEIVDFNADLKPEDMNVKVLEFVKETKKRVNIEEAKILVSAGRGIGGPENLRSLEALAEQLGGEVSGSRVTIDNGWLPKERQVGQTGKTVRPDLYIACGISGAIQHLAGMEESELIIAINKNPGASIFEVADVGIVGDLHKVLPLVTEELRKVKEEKENA